MREQWTPSTIGACLSAEFSGEWGDAPATGGNATVLRSTDIDNEGHVALRGGARRTIPHSKLLAKRLQLGDILLEASGGGPEQPVGRVALFQGGEDTYLCSNFFRTLRPNPNIVSPSFLVWRLQHIYAQPSIWALQQQTTGIINLKYHDYLRIPVQLPPLSEQRRIAEILDTLDGVICKTEQLVAKLKQVKQALLHDLLIRGIDDNGEVRDPVRHPEQFKDSQLGRIPNGWKVVPAGDVFDIQLGKMMSPTASVGPNQRRYLRNQNVLWDRLDLADVATMHFDTADLEKFRLRFGDLLACEGRFIGRCAIWRGEIDEAYYQKALHRLRARDARSTTDYMLFFMSLRFQYDRGFVEQMSHESTIPHLPLEKLVALPMLLPPRAEQDNIVGRLRAITAREQLESDYLAKVKTVKEGLMEDLLTGRVRATNLLTEAAA